MATNIIALGERQLRTLEAAGARLVEHPCRGEDDLVEHGREADALIIVNEPVTGRVIAELRRCRAVARLGVGVDMIDLDAATAAGIQVTNVPGASAEEVSDHAMAMVLAWARRLILLDAAVRRGNWSYLAGGAEVRRLSCQILGLVGVGRTGAALARKVSAFGMPVLGYDPYASSERIAAAGVRPVDLDELLSRSDYVSVHAPLSEETRGMIDAPALRLMKRSAYLINVSRGEIINQGALREALTEHRIAGAALDVLAEEPPRREDTLLRLPNVLLTPHAAHYSMESLEEVRQTAVEEVARILRSERPLHAVNDVSGTAGRAGLARDQR